MLYKTVAELSKDLKEKQYSSTELTQYFLDRITAHDENLNSFITVTADLALKQAADADKILSRGGDYNPLLGIPIAHKDIFCTYGVKTSCGSKMLDNFIAPYESTITKKMQDAGMVMLGKTNMDEFAMGSSNETSFYGAVKNPWNFDCVPGGSSGGAAACVAARIAPCATGTDTGGSIRQPAAFCGITGIKPSYGRVSRFGMIAFASSLDQAGPMTYSAEDAALLLNGMCGFDEKDSTSLNIETCDFTKNLNKDLSGLKIGVPKEYLPEHLNKDVADKTYEVIKQFEKMGATIKEISLENPNIAIPVYYVIAPAEASANLARFDGVRYGYRCEDPNGLADLYKRSRSEGFGDEVKKRILIGTHVLSSGYYDAYYLQAQKIRRIIFNQFNDAFKDVDVILGPTAPSTAFQFNSKKDPIEMYLNDIYTCAVNLAGLPAISFPAGFINNMPIGMQLIGKYLDESTLLNCVHKYQCETDWHKQIPQQFS